jgi:hypothetical protein
MKRHTKQTDARERAAIWRYCWAFGGVPERAPGGGFSPVDYVIRESSSYAAPVIAVVEVKCRDCALDTFTTVWAEERKVAALIHWSAIYEVEGWFVVEWADGQMRRIEVDRLKAISGLPVTRRRADRGDPADEDSIYEVPIDKMEVVPL